MRTSERPGEEAVAELVGAADRAQPRVEDRHPVAEPLCLLEPVGGEKDGDAAVAQPVDQVVHLPARHRVEPGGGLVEEEDRRIAEEHAGQPDPLAQALREAAAEIVGAVSEVDRVEGVPDPLLRVAQAVEAGEVLEILGHGQPQVEAGVLRHDGDASANLHTPLRFERHACDHRAARRRRDQGREHAHRRGLAGAVRTEEAEHLARGDGERDVVDREPAAEPLRQVLDHQRRPFRTAPLAVLHRQAAQSLALLVAQPRGPGRSRG